MALRLPEHLVEKARNFPESSYGANKVTVSLINGQKIPNVFLAWGEEIIKIDKVMITSEKDLPFNMEDISDVNSDII
jgi:hypothetical protein